MRVSDLLRLLAFLLPCFVAPASALVAQTPAGSVVFDVRAYGATGDGTTLDTDAINRAITAASSAGGGTVYFPAGTYLSYSVRLQSNLALYLDHGATLLAADPPAEGAPGGYDPAEPNEWGDKFEYQDFGHSHWRNSLIWGENLENISILGPGRIWGKGLTRGGNRRPGLGNKAIALKLCRNVTLRDFSVLMGGHFALLATGVDNLTIDNLRVDTNRDGFDIDACRNVRISNCTVNSPHDDAIVLKSSYGLGFARATENVTITNCQVTGFDPGTFLDGTYGRTMERAPDRDGPTGRIKFGTESNGGFRNITISNCVFERSRGLALELVDGGTLEDVTITNITMRDIVNAPIFIRLGNRARGPDTPPAGSVRRITLSNIVVYNADARYASIIAGLPGHPVEDVTLSNIRILYQGGLSLDQVAAQPAGMVNTFFLRGPGLTGPRDPFAPPEQEKAYPEPSMFGLLPAYGLYARHVKNLTVRDVEVGFMEADTRPAVVLDQVNGATFDSFRAQRAGDAPFFVLRSVTDFNVRNTPGLPDTRREASAAHERL